MNNLARRSFIKKSAGTLLGAMIFPGSFLRAEDSTTEFSVPNIKGDDPLLSNFSWKEMMQNHDLIWEKVPKDMTEAPHFGNGLIGSMLWIHENTIRLQVFRSDIHDHGDENYGWSAFSRPRYQIGYFTFQPKGEITHCKLRQDLYQAELSGSIHTTLGSLKIDHLVHKKEDVIYTWIETTGQEEGSQWQWTPFEAKGSRGGGPDSLQYGQAYAPYKKLINPEHRIEDHQGVKAGVQDLLQGGNYATAWSETNKGKKASTLLITIQNSYPEKTSVEQAIPIILNSRRRIDKDFQAWRDEHRAWWHNYYPESFVTFPDTVGQTFYWNNVYRLACCTRPDAQYIDTPGLWNAGGPWPYSTHDFNTQTAHFPVYTANRLHLGEALVESLHRNRQNLIDNVVPKEWQHDSAFLHLATAYDLKGKRDGDQRYSEMLGCLPWLLNNCWLHYRYTMDQEMLRETVFPLLRRSINLYRHLLYTGDDGKLHLPPTCSPETGITADCNFDLALLRWGCSRLIEICGILKINDPLLSEWEKIGNNLTPYPVDERGFRLGSDKTAPTDHQHMSHLMMIYPLYLENIDNNKQIGLLEKSVRNFRPPTALTKMAATQSSPAAAALGLGNLAHELMNGILYSQLENEKLGKNGMYYLATPCIETALGYNTCVQDMLLQSWGNKIRVFPALPDSWQEVAFHHFRAEGAFLVSACRKNGETTFVKIKSLAGEPCIIDPSIKGIPEMSPPNKNKLVKLENGFYLVDIKKGEELFLYNSNTKPDFVIEPLALERDKINYFGIK